MRVLSVSTGTHFITGLVSLDFCEGYMKDIFLFFKKFEKNLEKLQTIREKFARSKIELFPLRRVYEGKNHVTRARWLR